MRRSLFDWHANTFYLGKSCSRVEQNIRSSFLPFGSVWFGWFVTKRFHSSTFSAGCVCMFFIFYDFPFRIKSVSMHLFNYGDDLNRVCTWETHDFFLVFYQASMVNRTYDYTKFKENNNKILEKKSYARLFPQYIHHFSFYLHQFGIFHPMVYGS